MGAVLVSLAVVFVLLNLTLSGASRLKDIAAIVQSSVTAVAIVAGGIFSWARVLEEQPEESGHGGHCAERRSYH